MGCCFSSVGSNSVRLPTANIITLDGGLRQYAVPVTASEVLHMEGSSSSSSSSSSFLCNSDRLSFDDYIPALEAHHELQAHQIYFVLPASKLQHSLSASDMAALAVKASIALQHASPHIPAPPPPPPNNKARISPLSHLNQTPSFHELNNTSDEKPPAPGYSRSASFRKMQRYSPRRARIAVRSFRLRLTTIYEGTVL